MTLFLKQPTNQCNKTGVFADQYHFLVDPDPALYFNADPDLAFHFNPDPAPLRSDWNLRHLVSRPSRTLFRASNLLNVDFKAVWIQIFTLMRIGIQLPKTIRIHVDPDRQL
jgi:hypothetical protein